MRAFINMLAHIAAILGMVAILLITHEVTSDPVWRDFFVKVIAFGVVLYGIFEAIVRLKEYLTRRSRKTAPAPLGPRTELKPASHEVEKKEGVTMGIELALTLAAFATAVASGVLTLAAYVLGVDHITLGTLGDVSLIQWGPYAVAAYIATNFVSIFGYQTSPGLVKLDKFGSWFALIAFLVTLLLVLIGSGVGGGTPWPNVVRVLALPGAKALLGFELLYAIFDVAVVQTVKERKLFTFTAQRSEARWARERGAKYDAASGEVLQKLADELGKDLPPDHKPEIIPSATNVPKTITPAIHERVNIFRDRWPDGSVTYGWAGPHPEREVKRLSRAGVNGFHVGTLIEHKPDEGKKEAKPIDASVEMG